MAAVEPRRLTLAERQSFYTGSLTISEREMLPAALEMEGLDEEIAVLRVRLYRAIDANPDDFRLMTHGIGMLVRAVAAQYRLSPRARRDLAAQITAVLNSIGDQLLPPDR